MDEVLISDRRVRVVLQHAITPIVVSAIFCSLWLNIVGVDRDSVMTQQGLTANGEEKTDETGREEDIMEKQEGEAPLSQWTGRGEQLRELDNDACSWADNRHLSGPFGNSPGWTQREAKTGPRIH